MSYACLECGTKYRTTRAAERATERGCRKCGGVDIDLDVRTAPGDPAAHTAASIRRDKEAAGHDCEANAVPYESDGALGHGFECGVCGRFLQAG